MREIRDIPVGDLMSTAVVTVTPETSVEALTDLMTKHDYNGFPVVTETGRLVGLVAIALMVDHRIRTIPIVTDTPAGTSTSVGMAGGESS